MRFGDRSRGSRVTHQIIQILPRSNDFHDISLWRTYGDPRGRPRDTVRAPSRCPFLRNDRKWRSFLDIHRRRFLLLFPLLSVGTILGAFVNNFQRQGRLVIAGRPPQSHLLIHLLLIGGSGAIGIVLGKQVDCERAHGAVVSVGRDGVRAIIVVVVAGVAVTVAAIPSCARHAVHRHFFVESRCDYFGHSSREARVAVGLPVVKLGYVVAVDIDVKIFAYFWQAVVSLFVEIGGRGGFARHSVKNVK